MAHRLPESVAAAVLEFCETYRIVHRIDENTRTVHLVDIDHRVEVYRPR
jgi:hypothetical protein